MRHLQGSLIALLIATAVSAQTDYVVGAQDVLTVTVFGESDLSGKFTVEQDGTFTFPLIGRVRAGGVTLRALELDLRTQLADGYLRNPQVTVAVETYRSQRIFVMGEVRSPNTYQLTGDMTLIEALARAGGTTGDAGGTLLIVRPAPGGRPANGAEGDRTDTIRVDLADLQSGGLAQNVRLHDGDTIIVPRAQSVFVSGQVKNPGPYPVERGTTVLQVLSMAGGVTDRGARNRITILRTVNGKLSERRATENDIVQPGDTIKVPERFF